jgi:hypothetical protein
VHGFEFIASRPAGSAHDELRDRQDINPVRLLSTISCIHFWRSYSRRLLQSHHLQEKNRVVISRKVVQYWGRIICLTIRRRQEGAYTLHIQEIILPYIGSNFIFGRPVNWPCRQNIRCAICVSMCIKARREELPRRSAKSGSIPIWTHRPSQAYSLKQHVVCQHTDLGEAVRFCGVITQQGICRHICGSSCGVLEHCFRKHCGYDQQLARSSARLLT